MPAVRITSVTISNPPHWVTQAEAVQRVSAATGDPRHVAALGKGSHIDKRAVVVDPDTMSQFGTIEARNDIYRKYAPGLALAAARGSLGEASPGGIGRLVTASCTGYMLPGWDVHLIEELGLSLNTGRLPLTQPGCAGGVVALAQAAAHVRAAPQSQALAVAVELCSLAFHPRTDAGNLTAAMIFGDGAGAALVQSTDSSITPGVEVIDSFSALVPHTQDALGFALTDAGFYPLIVPELADILAGPTVEAVSELLRRNGLQPTDVGFWLVHPGGARILKGMERCFALEPGALRWSWDSLRECGNMSSVSIFDVLRRYLADEAAPGGWGVVIAFGPGLAIEMLLVRR